MSRISVSRSNGRHAGTAHEVTLIPGDGVGPDVITAARRVVEASGARITWDVVDAGEKALLATGHPLPPEVIASIHRTGVALKGPLDSVQHPHIRSVNVALRQQLDLYACVRPARSATGHRAVDVVIVRENLEDLHTGVEMPAGLPETALLIAKLNRLAGKSIRLDSGLAFKPISLAESRRIAEFAFAYAVRNNRRRVTVVHMADLMRHTDGLFVQAAREVAQRFPQIQFEERRADNVCMHLVMRPEEFDVLLLPNLYGDLISDLAAGLAGGTGVIGGANLGDRFALFEPTHGPARKHAALNRVNPLAAITSAALMLRHLGEQEPAAAIERAVACVVARGETLTYDMKPTRDDPTAAGTSQVADAVIAALGAESRPSPAVAATAV
jgi:isocitrate dehydrogenase (NAD+)